MKDLLDILLEYKLDLIFLIIVLALYFGTKFAKKIWKKMKGDK